MRMSEQSATAARFSREPFSLLLICLCYFYHLFTQCMRAAHNCRKTVSRFYLFHLNADLKY